MFIKHPTEVPTQTQITHVLCKLSERCIEEAEITLYTPGVDSLKLGRLVSNARLPPNHVQLKEYSARTRHYKEDHQECMDQAKLHLENIQRNQALIKALPEDFSDRETQIKSQELHTNLHGYIHSYNESIIQAGLHWSQYIHYVQHHMPVDPERFYAEITPLIEEYNLLMDELAVIRSSAC